MSEYSREEAIKDWNTRPIEDAQSAEIERLNERVTELSNALLVEKADNARMREALEELMSECENGDYLCIEYIKQLVEKALKGGE